MFAKSKTRRAKKGTERQKKAPELLQSLHECGALKIDPVEFDPCKRLGFEINFLRLLECVKEMQRPLKAELSIREEINGHCLIIKIGANAAIAAGPGKASAGQDVAVLDPNISNCLILLFAGNGGFGIGAALPVLGAGNKGQDGGNGGHCRILVKECNFIVAYAGDGRDAGGAQGGIVRN